MLRVIMKKKNLNYHRALLKCDNIVINKNTCTKLILELHGPFYVPLSNVYIHGDRKVVRGVVKSAKVQICKPALMYRANAAVFCT